MNPVAKVRQKVNARRATKKKRYRSAKSGRYVSRWYAITHPSTTVREED